MKLEQFKGQNLDELSMVEVAYAMLEQSGEVIGFTELLINIQEFLQLNEAQLEERMTRFYTDLNIDGRFISLGDNRWGLRAWYAIDAIDEEIISSIDDEDIPAKRRRKKRKLNVFSEGDDMIDYNDDDPEDTDDYTDEDEIFDDADNEDDEDDSPEVVVGLEVIPEGEDEEEDPELTKYASDLDEFDSDEIDLDEEIDEELDEEDDFEDEEEEEVLEDDYSDDDEVEG